MDLGNSGNSGSDQGKYFMIKYLAVFYLLRYALRGDFWRQKTHL